MSVDEAISVLAGKQLGLITRAQLLKLGVSKDAIDSRVRAKRLRPLHRGVYRVGPLAVQRARELAAVLACGPHACLSHRNAGWLWQLLPDPGDRCRVDVSITRGDRGRRRGIHVRRVMLDKNDLTTLHGIPITALPRTLLDLANVLDVPDLERVLAQAERLHQVDRSELTALATRGAGRRGVRVLRAFTKGAVGPALTRSEAEARFLALIRKAELPEPESNVQVKGYEVDFLWRGERLVVEVDGFAFHAPARVFENDRRRDARLMAHGLTVQRVTWRQIVEEPEATVVRVAQTLARAGVDPAPEGKRKRGAPLRLE